MKPEAVVGGVSTEPRMTDSQLDQQNCMPGAIKGNAHLRRHVAEISILYVRGREETFLKM